MAKMRRKTWAKLKTPQHWAWRERPWC